MHRNRNRNEVVRRSNRPTLIPHEAGTVRPWNGVRRPTRRGAVVDALIQRWSFENELLRVTAIILPVILIASLGSCDDDDPSGPDPATLVGFWTGKYGNGDEYPTSGYAFLFNSDGTVAVWVGVDTTTADKAEGTYTQSGTTVNTNYTYIGGGNEFSTSGTVNPDFTFQEGTWGGGANTTNGGHFFVVKE